MRSVPEQVAMIEQLLSTAKFDRLKAAVVRAACYIKQTDPKYARLEEHQIVRILLDPHVDPNNPKCSNPS